MFDSSWWSLTIILAPLVLGGAIAYALLTRRRTSRAEREVRDRETRKQYRDETDGPV